MVSRLSVLETDQANWSFFEKLPEAVPHFGGDGAPPKSLDFTKVKEVQLLDPLFEFSSACAGCGETPYLGLMSRLFGDRALIANATGCSSIYGGNLPTTPWAVNSEGRGPAWSNSLFEDNAEFGLGFRVAVSKQAQYARELVEQLGSTIGHELAAEMLEGASKDEPGYAAQRERIVRMKERLSQSTEPTARDLEAVADALVPRSVWIVGGDGWAYDIGYGGLDHVVASGENVNLLVLDTEVYSNTGGQASKATGLGAVAKFAAGGKPTPKKDLGLLAMGYGYVYVAQIALGANDNHTIKTFLEAEAYDGPSLIIAYSPCIAHGIDMARANEQQKLATASGHWPLYRYDPRRKLEGKNPLQIDSKPPSVPLKEYIYSENRYRVLQKMHPEAAADFLQKAQEGVNAKWKLYQMMAQTTSRGVAEGGRPKPGKPPARPGKPRPKMPPK
jgi:pyruvate-ferredoxin/flavodoxin oxidoreductase